MNASISIHDRNSGRRNRSVRLQRWGALVQACRKGGTVSVPGVYSGFLDKIPMDAFMNKALSMKTGQTHMMRFMQPLLEGIQNGKSIPASLSATECRLTRRPGCTGCSEISRNTAPRLCWIRGPNGQRHRKYLRHGLGAQHGRWGHFSVALYNF